MAARRKRRKRSKPLRRVFFYTRHLMLWFVLAGITYWLWIDFTVGRTKSLREWQVPARIYARPQEIFVGATLSRSELESVLVRIGYIRSASLEGPGQYALRGDGIALFVREHAFPDGVEPARKVTLTFSRRSVATITDFAGRGKISSLRLEPEEIGIVHGEVFEDRVLLEYEDLPPEFVDYLIAVEDRRYFRHFGLDPLGIARAAVNNILAGRIAEGGSTLTQQLAKNLYLNRSRSWTRKIREALIAISLERRFTKQEILEAYVNEVFLGQSGNRAIHGFGLAARYYFGKPLADLDLRQAAMLVGLVKAPSAYNPHRHPQAAAGRIQTVLKLLRDQGLVSGADFASALDAKLDVRSAESNKRGEFGAVVELVRNQLRRDFRDDDLQYEGLKINTTINPGMQSLANRIAADALAEVERERKISAGSLEVGIIVANWRTADIVALVGGRAGRAAGFNRALKARRPIGSLVKPFVYSVALDRTDEYNVLSMLDDAPLTVPLDDGETWSPKNYDGKFHGPVSLFEAFTRSYNLATVNLGLDAGIDVIAKRLRAVGFEEGTGALPSLLLGAVDATPFAVAQAYQGIANDGFKVPLRAIASVTDAENNGLTRYPPRVEQVFSPQTAFLVQYLLSATVSDGTARYAAGALSDLMPLAGKTGTSNDGRDSWFSGFGGDYLAVVWVGRDDNRPTNLTGASGALRVWTALMHEIGPGPFTLTPPTGVLWETVSSELGAIVQASCPDAVRIPLALPTGLVEAETCDAPDSSVSGRETVWGRLQGLFR